MFCSFAVKMLDTSIIESFLNVQCFFLFDCPFHSIKGCLLLDKTIVIFFFCLRFEVIFGPIRLVNLFQMLLTHSDLRMVHSHEPVHIAGGNYETDCDAAPNAVDKASVPFQSGQIDGVVHGPDYIGGCLDCANASKDLSNVQWSNNLCQGGP